MKPVFFKELELVVFPSVYEPSEDSFLLAENVSLPRGATALDLGCGSGIQGINAALLGASKVVFTDLDRNALGNAEENTKLLPAGTSFEFRQGNLFKCLGKKEGFGAIIFNPPYVESKGKRFRDLDGGREGREVLDRFLKGFAKHLKKGGKCFFLQTSLNGEKKTAQILGEQGLSFEVLARKRLFFEELLVFGAWKRKK